MNEPAARPGVLVLANPVAGQGRGEAAGRELVRCLQELGLAAELRLSRGPEDIRRWAAEPPPSVGTLVTVGGDGTLNLAVDSLQDLSLRVTMLPLGTANVLRKTLDLPRDPAGCARMLAAGAAVPFDVGVATPEEGPPGRFVMMAGVGFDAACTRALHERRTGPIRMTDYLGPVLQTVGTFRHPGLQIALEDGEVLEDVLSVVIGNVREYGGPFCVAAGSHPTSGSLELIAFRGRNPRRDILRYMVAGLAARTHTLHDVCVRASRQIEVRSASGHAVPFQLDGDHRGTTPVRFHLAPERLWIVAPAARARALARRKAGGAPTRSEPER